MDGWPHIIFSTSVFVPYSMWDQIDGLCVWVSRKQADLRSRKVDIGNQQAGQVRAGLEPPT